MSKKLDYSSADFIESTPNWLSKANKNSKFDDLLRNGWDKAMEEGVFRYTMGHLETKILDGPKQYVAQLNVKRATDRRQPQNITSLNQPFNPDTFNFTKIKETEILLTINNTDDEKSSNNKEIKNCLTPVQDRNLIIVNISPLEYGHVLVVPQVDSCLPQILTRKALQVALETVLLSARRSFRLGFNSLCAYASVNHQHFHAYYLEHELVVEYGPVQHITGVLYQSDVMPVPGFVFQTHENSVSTLTRVIHKITQYFQKNEIAHSVLLTRGAVFNEDKTSDNRTVRIYVWPRQKFKGSKSLVELHVAVIELGGHLPIKDENSYKNMTEKEADSIIETAKLPEEEFQKIKSDVTKIVFEDSEDKNDS
ncbi:GDP-D-glucose phosphorylase 1 isoform X2 [Patella vulgata]|uniref:GDP-D-glucose phosphorylase 1 isoform X2 n=1 Tax=Patella vulgata TaxID=6465 RepID=UPI00217F4E5D|nr:GDP-D-glucose phosphorylase 1 isoform X2 [Patella vulgata]